MMKFADITGHFLYICTTQWWTKLKNKTIRVPLSLHNCLQMICLQFKLELSLIQFNSLELSSIDWKKQDITR